MKHTKHTKHTSIKRRFVGDIDITYKRFGRGYPFLLISDSGMNLGAHKSLRNHIRQSWS